MEVSQVIQELISYSQKKKYQERISYGLISPVFPSSFNLSGSHADVQRIANYDSQLKEPERFYMLDRALRHNDTERVGYGNHCTFFEMITNVNGIPSRDASQEEIIKEIYDVLIDTFRLDSKRLFVTVFGGGYVQNKNYPPDQKTYDAWIKTGIPKNNVIFVKGHDVFVFLTTDKDPAGPRSEIYYDLGEQISLPFRFLEIATAVFETHRFHGESGGLVGISNYVFGNAFGIERLTMAVNGYKNLFEIDTLQPLVEIVRSYINNNRFQLLSEVAFRRIADHVRAIMFCYYDGQEPDNSKRGEILKKLLKDITNYVKLLYIDREMDLYRELVACVSKKYEIRYSHLSDSAEKVLENLRSVRKRGIYKPDLSEN